jgi:hypothetical protein
VEHGLLINFGSYKFQIRKFALSSGTGPGLTSGIVAVFSALLALFAVKSSA